MNTEDRITVVVLRWIFENNGEQYEAAWDAARDAIDYYMRRWSIVMQDPDASLGDMLDDVLLAMIHELEKER